MKARNFVRFIINKYPLMYRDFKKFLISEVIPKIPENTNVKITQINYDEILEKMYDVMESKVYDREKASLIILTICSYVKT